MKGSLCCVRLGQARVLLMMLVAYRSLGSSMQPLTGRSSKIRSRKNQTREASRSDGDSGVSIRNQYQYWCLRARFRFYRMVGARRDGAPSWIASSIAYYVCARKGDWRYEIQILHRPSLPTMSLQCLCSNFEEMDPQHADILEPGQHCGRFDSENSEERFFKDVRVICKFQESRLGGVKQKQLMTDLSKNGYWVPVIGWEKEVLGLGVELAVGKPAVASTDIKVPALRSACQFSWQRFATGQTILHEDIQVCANHRSEAVRARIFFFFFLFRLCCDLVWRGSVALFYPLSSGPRSVASSSRPQVSAPSSSSLSSRRTCLLLYLCKSRRSGMMGAETISAAVVRSAPAGRRIDRAMTFWTATPRSVHHRRRYAA